ncbi:MAG: class II fructose-bisphosphate aldolase family protein [Chloroflexi bacterium]|nr:class II fructose-bisphosphate aldolase family protein [Chloroflexota bacterium]
MPHIPAAELLLPAWREGRAIAAFNVIGIEHAEAIATGAERATRPVILAISQNCVTWHGALAPIAAAALAVARAASVPVGVHLDHAVSRELVIEAIDLGIDSVMFDASALDDAANRLATAEVAGAGHARGAWVEAELGAVGGKDGIHSATARTDPDAAVRFVEATGVDALAVAVGSSHARPTRDAALDLALVARLRAVVPVPLVLHGSSGVSDDGLAAAVGAGLTKINIATQLNRVFSAAVRDTLAADPAMVDPRRYLGPGRDAIAEEVARLLDVLGPV